MAAIAIVMGSVSDWATMKLTAEQFDDLGISYSKQVISAHRMPAELTEFAQHAHDNGVQVIIAGAGGAAHLPGMLAANTTIPVIGVPIKTRTLNGLDSLLSIVQMPAGIPVATVAIGTAGAKNAALLATAILGLTTPDIAQRLAQFREQQHQASVKSGEQLV